MKKGAAEFIIVQSIKLPKFLFRAKKKTMPTNGVKITLLYSPYDRQYIINYTTAVGRYHMNLEFNFNFILTH